VRILQTNSAGDNIHIIDPTTNKVVGIVSGIEVNHGATATPDGRYYFFSNEADHTLDAVDTKTLKVVKKITLSGRPNNITISKTGQHVYVSIVSAPGAVDVIDTQSLSRVKSIPTEGGIHNTYVTPDGKFIVAGSIAGKKITVIDGATEKPLWTTSFDLGVRPITFETKPDGSTSRIFLQLSDYNGFVIVDFATHKEVRRVDVPQLPMNQRETEGLQASPSHGIGVTPDNKTLWVLSKMNSRVYEYALPDLKLIGEAKTGSHPDWLTFTPDSKSVYIANAGSNSVSVIDVATRKEVTRIPVGQVPKRIVTAVMP
jgi:YVTN family beta-propeller protein